MITRRAVLGGGAAAIVSTLASCGPEPKSATLTVLAAASLTDALTEVGRLFTAGGGPPVRFSFAASSAIARQVEAGAPADLVFTADLEWMDYLAERRLIDASRRNLLAGRLALVAPASSTAALAIRPSFALAEALGPRGRLAMGDPASVPAGRYAREALTELQVWPAVQNRVALADNVRVALAYVSRGEAPLGIVYETDAVAEPGVRIVGLFPDGSHAPILYPVALTRRAAPGARRFYDFANGPAAAQVFERRRFTVLGRTG